MDYMEDDMVRNILMMVVREGAEQRFERIWYDSAEDIKHLPGQRGQSLVREIKNTRRYTITSDWTSAEALRAFEASSLRVSLSAALDPLRESASKAVVDVLTILKGEEVAQP
jgi:heme-degrading monooxygenase HmoA